MLWQCCLSSLPPDSYLPDLVHVLRPVEYSSPSTGSVWAPGLIFLWKDLSRKTLLVGSLQGLDSIL